MWNPSDKQDVTVIWRFPVIATQGINSNKVIVDMHDVASESDFPPETLQPIHKIFVKSRFHRSLFPNISDDKFAIVPNGIDAKLFLGACERDPLLLINTSAPERSLQAFLDCFEQIKQQVAGAKAQWAYGWDLWDARHSAHAQPMQWKAQMQQRMKELGVEELGRLNRHEITSLYRKANVFAYPSEMAETDCISLSESHGLGSNPRHHRLRCVRERNPATAAVFIYSSKTKDNWIPQDGFQFDITDAEQKTQFVRETVKLLKNSTDRAGPAVDEENGPAPPSIGTRSG